MVNSVIELRVDNERNITRKEIILSLKKMKSARSPLKEKTQTEIIKEFCENMTKWLVRIFNIC